MVNAEKKGRANALKEAKRLKLSLALLLGCSKVRRIEKGERDETKN